MAIFYTDSASFGDISLSGSLLISGNLSFVQNSGGLTGSLLGTSSWATTASFATTASAATSITFTPTTASFATTASAATSITFTPSTASFATTASFALNAGGSGFPFSGSAAITGSLTVSSSRSVPALTLFGSGSTVFAISGSTGPLFEVTDSTSSGDLFTLTSASIDIFKVDNTKTVNISGSLKVTGSVFINALTDTTATNKLVVLNTATNQLFTTASISPISSSFATTASAATSITFTPSTASFATTSSAATSITFTPTTASFATTASSATSITFVPTTASFATTASYALNATSTSAFPYDGRTTPALISGSLIVSSSTNTPGIRVTGSIGILSGSLTSSNDILVGPFGNVRVGNGNPGTNNDSIVVGNGLASNTGAQNTSVGYNALLSNLTATQNTAIGYQALRVYAGAGGTNTAVGAFAMNNGTGAYNTAVGVSALELNDSSNQVAVGWNALSKGGGSNGSSVGIGVGALQNASGSGGGVNTAVGTQALQTLTIADNHVAVGYLAGGALGRGSSTVLLGSNALNGATTASYVIAIGPSAGASTTAGAANLTPTNNIYIGYDTRAAANNTSNEIVIGYLASGSGTNTFTYGNSSITRHIFTSGTIEPQAVEMAVSGAITASGTVSLTLDLNGSNFFRVSGSAAGTVTWAITNPPPAGKAQTFIIEYTNGGTKTNSWFTNTRWPAGSAPTLSATANPDLLSFTSDDAGANWRGVLLQRGSA